MAPTISLTKTRCRFDSKRKAPSMSRSEYSDAVVRSIGPSPTASHCMRTPSKADKRTKCSPDRESLVAESHFRKVFTEIGTCKANSRVFPCPAAIIASLKRTPNVAITAAPFKDSAHCRLPAPHNKYSAGIHFATRRLSNLRCNSVDKNHSAANLYFPVCGNKSSAVDRSPVSRQSIGGFFLPGERNAFAHRFNKN